jgi:hypothetical protein
MARERLGRDDGPMLEALKRLNGETIHLPGRIKDCPDRDRLAMRFERDCSTIRSEKVTSKDKTALISGGLVSCMLVVAWSEFQHGKPLGEIHLITPAPLTAGSTVVFTGAGYHHSSVRRHSSDTGCH